ncbi:MULTISPECIES: hypothetical protein [unclassified Micromonospora]|uniref:hypothetical protein n=1 Tax=unclassified Micromonospora TaxID=2617518 RepID=UPI0022B66B8F|nr:MULTISPECIES: hypothetical protein [unclassified Micromonospora]MCZ7423011.1 hypothetical protein [Verrucosispora sp. WMMA2121]WBB90717.1 hypothetical protein O7597_27720 [Verrucosispora sp. WMMC514]
MHVNLPVNRARWCDLDWIVDLLTATLVPTHLGAWLVPDERRRPAVIAAVARIWTEHALLFGDAFLLRDGTAATVWFHRYRPIPPPPRYDERLDDASGEHAVRFRRVDRLLAARRPAEAHNHLAFLAAPPDPDRAGQAAAVLAGSHRHMDNVGLPTYAEAHGDDDLRLYRRLGYRDRQRLSCPGGATVNLLWRPVRPVPIIPSTLAGRPVRPAGTTTPNRPVVVAVDVAGGVGARR